jgi:hypothetical protein
MRRLIRMMVSLLIVLLLLLMMMMMMVMSLFYMQRLERPLVPSLSPSQRAACSRLFHKYEGASLLRIMIIIIINNTIVLIKF